MSSLCFPKTITIFKRGTLTGPLVLVTFPIKIHVMSRDDMGLPVFELSVLIWCSLHVKQVLNAPTKPFTFCYFLHEIAAESQTPNSWVAVSLATRRLEEKKRKVFIPMPRRKVLWDYM